MAFRFIVYYGNLVAEFCALFDQIGPTIYLSEMIFHSGSSKYKIDHPILTSTLAKLIKMLNSIQFY